MNKYIKKAALLFPPIRALHARMRELRGLTNDAQSYNERLEQRLKTLELRLD